MRRKICHAGCVAILLGATPSFPQPAGAGLQLAVDCGRYLGNGELLARLAADPGLAGWLSALDEAHCRGGSGVVVYQGEGGLSAEAACRVVDADPAGAFTVLTGSEASPDYCS